MHNPRGRHSRQRAELYIFIMTIPGLKAIKCLALTKSICYDNLPTTTETKEFPSSFWDYPALTL